MNKINKLMRTPVTVPFLNEKNIKEDTVKSI